MSGRDGRLDEPETGGKKDGERSTRACKIEERLTLSERRNAKLGEVDNASCLPRWVKEKNQRAACGTDLEVGGREQGSLWYHSGALGSAPVSTGSQALFHGRGEKKKKNPNGRVSTAPVEHWRVMVSGVVVDCGQHLKFQRDCDPVVVDVAARRSSGSMDWDAAGA